jgi:hypothetical protein
MFIASLFIIVPTGSNSNVLQYLGFWTSMHPHIPWTPKAHYACDYLDRSMSKGSIPYDSMYITPSK